jgi:hypothetical protein
MRYLTIDNGIVTGHYATSADTLPENGVEITELVGTYGLPVTHYKVQDGVWTQKNTVELIREGLLPMPDGYQWNADQTAIELIPQPEAEAPEPTQKERIEAEIAENQTYLDSTDYGVIKCAENGLYYASIYPEEHTKRQQARDRINELRALLNTI